MMQPWWLSFGHMQLAARRHSSMNRSMARSTGWTRSRARGRRSPCIASTLHAIYLHEAVRGIVDATDHGPTVLLEPLEKTGAVGGDVGRVEVVAHVRVEQNHVWGDPREALLERQAFVGPV